MQLEHLKGMVAVVGYGSPADFIIPRARTLPLPIEHARLARNVPVFQVRAGGAATTSPRRNPGGRRDASP
jgi:hypothetical protein